MKIAIIPKTYHALGRFLDLISDYDKIALTYDEYYTYGLGKGLHEYLDIITEEKRSSRSLALLIRGLLCALASGGR